MASTYVNGLYRNDDDIRFVNTQYFREAAMHFLKHGVYTREDSSSLEYKAYWDEEERRCREGYTVGGIHITGEHYGYLNYAQIQVTQDTNKHSIKEVSKEGHSKRAKRITASKKEIFPDFYDGDYHYFKAKEFARNEGLHLCVGKARRKGYSYKNGWIASNRYNLYPKSITVIGAHDSSYLYPRGTMQMVKEYMDFTNKHTDWYKRRLINKREHVKSGFKIVGKDEDYGYQSEVIAVSFNANPGAARGKDGTLFMFEEAGKFPNLLESLTSTAPAVEDGIYVTGQILIFGTGGDDDSNWDGFEEIFYNPDTYNMLAFENVWDENALDTACGFFVPQVWNLPGFIDKDGNSKIEEATVHETENKEAIKKTAKTSSTLNSYQMEYPNMPSEAFARSSNNMFPVLELDQQLKRVQNDPNIKYLGRQGKYVESKEGVKLMTTKLDGTDHNYITEFPVKKASATDVAGCIIEWVPPYTDPNGNVPAGLYRIWHDPYAQDKDTDAITTKDSLGSTYVYQVTNRFTPSTGDILVAAYTGRPSTMDGYNQQLYLLAKRYGASPGMVMFENDRGDVKNYFKKKQAYHLLADEPEVLWKKELQSVSTGRDKGIMMNEKRKAKAAIYLRDWLSAKRGTDVNGNDVLNLNYIYDEGLLKELLKWNKKGNFDRASAMLVGMFDYREVETKEEISISNQSTHSFFNKNLF